MNVALTAISNILSDLTVPPKYDKQLNSIYAQYNYYAALSIKQNLSVDSKEFLVFTNNLISLCTKILNYNNNKHIKNSDEMMSQLKILSNVSEENGIQSNFYNNQFNDQNNKTISTKLKDICQQF